MTKEQLREKFDKECYDEFHSSHQARFIFDWFYSEIENRDKENQRLNLQLLMLEERIDVKPQKE